MCKLQCHVSMFPLPVSMCEDSERAVLRRWEELRLASANLLLRSGESWAWACLLMRPLSRGHYDRFSPLLLEVSSKTKGMFKENPANHTTVSKSDLFAIRGVLQLGRKKLKVNDIFGIFGHPRWLASWHSVCLLWGSTVYPIMAIVPLFLFTSPSTPQHYSWSCHDCGREENQQPYIPDVICLRVQRPFSFSLPKIHWDPRSHRFFWSWTYLPSLPSVRCFPAHPQNCHLNTPVMVHRGQWFHLPGNLVSVRATISVLCFNRGKTEHLTYSVWLLTQKLFFN